MSTATDPRTAARTLGALAGLVVVATAVLRIGPFIVAAGHDHVTGEIDSLETLWRVVTVPAALFAAVVLIGVATFGSWRRTWFEDRPAASWVRGVAMALIAAALVAIDYRDLADAGLGMAMLILFTSLLLAVGSEVLFRGLAVDVLRERGLDELQVGAVSSALYGAVHLLAVVTEGPDTVVHVVVMALLGLAFYALRRVSGSLVLPIVAHGLIDVAFLSTRLGDHPGDGLPTAMAVLAMAVLSMVVLVRRRAIDRGGEAAAAATHPNRHTFRSGVAWVGRGAIVFVLLLVIAAVVPVSSRGLAADPSPTTGYDDALARFREITASEDDLAVFEPCRSRILDHGERTEIAVVLYHGLTNCPQQFVELGRRLYADGANVVILRAPHHGLAANDGSTIGGVGLVGDLSADDLRDWADESIDIASGLGEHVQVMGLSMGGAVSMWTAQFRNDVDRVVALAPAISVPRGPHFLTTVVVNAFNRLPDFSVPTNGSRLEHAYAGQSTGALAGMLLLARATENEIARRPAAATEVVVVLNPNDDQVDNDEVRQLVERWRDGDGAAEIVTLPDVGLPHDLIDPDQPDGDVEFVYPLLIDLLERPPG